VQNEKENGFVIDLEQEHVGNYNHRYGPLYSLSMTSLLEPLHFVYSITWPLNKTSKMFATIASLISTANTSVPFSMSSLK
jgi:hypothetical protein